MRVIFMGSPVFSVPVLDRLVADGHEICAVYCQPPRPAGRGKKDRPTPVQARATELGLTVRHPLSLKGADAQAAFVDLGADVAVVVAYGLILPLAILAAPRWGCVNIHASLLPRWRGAAPIHRAIMAGDPETGICLMQMDAGLDTGPVLRRQSVPIGPEETTGSLHDQLSHLGAQMCGDLLATDGPWAATPQPQVGVTYATKIDKAEGKLDWSAPADQVDRHIRGLSPAPGAWTLLGGKRLKLLGSRLSSGSGVPGTVIAGADLTIACGTGAVTLTEVQIEGRGRQSATDFLNGHTLPVGTQLGGT